jgi:Glycosyl hydrolase catalytic core
MIPASAARIATEYSGLQHSNWILGFNEPNNPGIGGHFQTITQAVVNWHTIEISYPNKLLVSPVPASSLPYNDDNWLARFRTAYSATYGYYPRFDALAIHAYFSYAWEGENMVVSATQKAQAWGIPEVWVTEWGIPYHPGYPSACTSIPSGSYTETRSFMSWLNTNISVTHYAWYGTYINIPLAISLNEWPHTLDGLPTWCDLSLVYTNTNLTSFGTVYVSP